MNTEYLELLKAVNKVAVEVVLPAGDDPKDVKRIRIEGRRLTGAEARILDAMRLEATPPVDPATKELNYRDPDYLRKSDEIDGKVRALTVFWCFKDLFDVPVPTDFAEVQRVVDAQPAGLIELLHEALKLSPVKDVRLVNFFSPAPAPGS